MRKPVVDYRKLRLRNINTPQFRHVKLLLGWVGYFVLYALTENLIPAESCHLIYSRLDGLIPFNEFFVIFYVGWYVLIVGSLVWFLLYNVENFKNLQTYIIITQILATVVYVLYPSRQELRPEAFPRENILTAIMALIYRLDTNTGVLPSLHVAYSIGIASTWLREKQVSIGFRVFIVIFVIGVCLSVAFVKQHSVLDIFAAIPVCMIAEWYVFWRKRKKETGNEKMGR